MLATFLLKIDPIIVNIAGPISIRWYGVAYMIGISLGIWLLAILNKSSDMPQLQKKTLDDMLVYMTLGIIIGGRLGYIIFYDLSYYLENPVTILMIWEGGMSFHGGFLGLILALYLLCQKHKTSFLMMGDLVVCVVPVGLFFGRIANFINGELYGRVTTVSWGVVFPDVDYLPRHPSQLYEAFLEGILLLIIMITLRTKSKMLSHPGQLSGTFAILYGILRLLAEIYREPDAHIGFIAQYLTMGQILSLPMIVFGICLLRPTSQKYHFSCLIKRAHTKT